MTKEKNLNASKQPDNSQNKFADELLSDDELDKIAGGTGDTSELVLFDGRRIYSKVSFVSFKETGK